MHCAKPNPNFSSKLKIAILALGVLSVPSTALLAKDIPAQTIEPYIQDDGSSERIALSGKLRMLGQRVVAASCFLQSGIATDDSRAVLAAASTEFMTITDALEFGDANLGIIGAEDRRRTLAGISKLRELWDPIAVLASKVESGTGNMDDVAEIAVQSAPLLDLTKRLVVQISGQYANQTTILQQDVLAIDIAGRQRMLAQRVSKNICLDAAGINVAVSQPELASAASDFEASLMALRHGMQQAGIRTPPNKVIEDGLDAVIANWAIVSPLVQDVGTGGTLDEQQLETVFYTSNALTGGMNAVVGMYSDASKLGA
jgi:hypothetical protein